MFSPVSGVNLDATVLSNEIVAPIDGNIDIYGGNALFSFITVNGVNSGTSASFTAGDIVRVSFKTGNANDTLYFKLVNYLNKEYAFSALTKPAVTGDQNAIKPEYAKLLPYEYTEPFTPSNANNKVLITDTQSSNQTHSQLVANNTPYVRENQLLVASYHESAVYVVSLQTGVVLKTINITRPFGVHYTPYSSVESYTKTLPVVTCPEDDKVFVLTEDYQILNEVNVTGKPIAVHGAKSDTAGSFSFWVSCYDESSLKLYTKANEASAPTLTKTVTVDNGPSYLSVNPQNGIIYASCMVPNMVAMHNYVSDETDYILMTSTPAAIGTNDEYGFVCAPEDNSILIFRIETLIGMGYHDVGFPCYNISVEGDVIWVSSLEGEFKKYTFDRDTETLIEVDYFVDQRVVYGMTSNGNKLYSVHLYEDAPTRLQIPNSSPLGFLIDPVQAQGGQEVTTSPVSLAGMQVSGTIHIPDIFGAKLYINDVLQQDGASIENGDVIRIEFTAPLNDGVYKIPILSGNTVTEVEVTVGNPQIKTRVAGWMGGG